VKSGQDEPEPVEGEEVVISEMVTGDDERVIRVYDKDRGDFELTIPAKSRVTFGYFNPAAAGGGFGDEYGRSRAAQTMRTTALRVYEAGEKSPQLACFLGVDGFRDKALTITRLRQRVVIESNFEDDGGGNTQFHRQQHAALNAVSEDELEDDTPF
jgi:hypothetical protein